MPKKDEIIAGLKSAMHRGEKLEQAKSSFINAGYDRQDVEDSALALSGVIGRIPEQPQIKQRKPEEQIQPPKTPASKIQPEQKKKSSKLKILIVILIIIFILLLGILLTSIFFGGKAINFISNLF